MTKVIVTGVGSLPGRDMGEALRQTFELVPDLPYLPELPARGPWAAMIGRGLGLPDGLAAEYEAGEWRLASTAGVDQRRARATLRDDLDQLEEVAQGYRGRAKVQVAGPWTLAASTAVAMSGRVLADKGARRDLAGALAQGVGELAVDLYRRLPGIDWTVQVDEPSLPAVLAGSVPTPGGFFRHDAVDIAEAVAALAAIVAEPGRRGVPVTSVLHCCAPGLPIAAMMDHGRDGAGFDAVNLDADMVMSGDLDALAQAWDAGRALWLGVLPTLAPDHLPGVDDLRRRTLRLLEDLGAGDDGSGRLVLTPACGLAGFPHSLVEQAFKTLGRVASQVAEEMAG